MDPDKPAKPKGRKPDYRLKFLDRLTEEKGDVGAGWQNPDGSITIQLNPCVTLTRNVNHILTLFRP